MRSFGRCCVLAFSLWVAVMPAVADTEVSERIVSLPISETGEVIAPWLETNGFKLFHVSETGPSIRLEAETTNRRWMISLKAHSPLATRIQVQTRRVDDPLLTALWNHLDSYVKMPNAPASKVKPLVSSEVRNQLNAVVCIYFERERAPVQLSGFVIERSGLILSTAHDLKQEQVVSVQFRNGDEMNGRVIRLDARYDLCLVQVPGPLDNAVPLKDGRFAPFRGEILYALDCPKGGLESIKNGTLDGPPRQVDGLLLWQVRMQVDPGSSGSPVLDDQGRLMGVIKGRFRGTNAVGFVIPFETLLLFMEMY